MDNRNGIILLSLIPEGNRPGICPEEIHRVLNNLLKDPFKFETGGNFVADGIEDFFLLQPFDIL